MARPIPNNPAGRRPEHVAGWREVRVFQAEAFVPPIAAGPHPPQPAARPVGGRLPLVVDPARGRPWLGPLLLLISAVLGIATTVVALQLGPAWGLADREGFYLTATGIYLVSTTLYAAWQTRLMQDMASAPADARLLAYLNVAIGGLACAAIGLTALAALALFLIVAFLLLLLLGGDDGVPS